MSKHIIKETEKLAFKLLGIAFPLIAAYETITNFCGNISNYILLDKIKRFVEAQDSDFEEWLKISCDFQNDFSEYKSTVKMLIYVIESINDEMKIDVYANLMRAYKVRLLDKRMFIKLSSMLSTLHYDDLIFLQNCVGRELCEIFEDGNFISIAYANLINNGLLYCTTDGLWDNTREDRRYKITKPGLEMIRCGIEYNNYDKYKDLQIIYEVREKDLQPVTEEQISAAISRIQKVEDRPTLYSGNEVPKDMKEDDIFIKIVE